MERGLNSFTMAAAWRGRSMDPESVALEIAKPDDVNVCMNEDAFRILYEQTSLRLFRYLLRVSGRRDVAQDVLQETYCHFLAAPLPPMDAARTRSYLFRIATNLMRDRWRRRKEESLPENVAEMVSTSPRMDQQLHMRQAFFHLRPRDRQFLWLAYVEGFSHKEIAKTIGVRAGSVRLLLFRARRKLAQLLKGCHDPVDREGLS